MPNNSERLSSMEGDNFLERNQLYRAFDDLTSSPSSILPLVNLYYPGKLAYRCRSYDDNWWLTLSSWGFTCMQKGPYIIAIIIIVVVTRVQLQSSTCCGEDGTCLYKNLPWLLQYKLSNLYLAFAGQLLDFVIRNGSHTHTEVNAHLWI